MPDNNETQVDETPNSGVVTSNNVTLFGTQVYNDDKVNFTKIVRGALGYISHLSVEDDNIIITSQWDMIAAAISAGALVAGMYFGLKRR